MSRMHTVWKHTFFLGAVVGHTPCLAVISNWQNGKGKTWDESCVFSVCKITGRKTRVLVAGLSYCERDKPENRALHRVVRHQVRYLKSIANCKSHRPNLIRTELYKSNRIISSLTGFAISVDCSVSSDDVFGNFRLDGYGTTPLLPRQVVLGTDANRVIKLAAPGRSYGGSVMVGIVGIRNFPDTPEPPVCRPLGQTWPGSPFTLAEIHDSDNSAVPLCCNDLGEIFGRIRLQDGLDHPCIWVNDDKFGILKGGPGVVHSAVGDFAAGVCQRDGIDAATLWSQGDVFSINADSSALGVNTRGEFVGWISFEPGQADKSHHRPLIWTLNGPKACKQLPFGADRGEAVDIDDRGVALVSLFQNDLPRAFLWTDDELIDLGAPDFSPGAVRPRKILQKSSVVCDVSKVDGSYISMVRIGRNGKWVKLLDDGYELGCVNNRLTSCGVDTNDGLSRPWIKAPRRSLERLPYLIDHDHALTHISKNNTIIGAAFTDYCMHRILWRPMPGAIRSGLSFS